MHFSGDTFLSKHMKAAEMRYVSEIQARNPIVEEGHIFRAVFVGSLPRNVGCRQRKRMPEAVPCEEVAGSRKKEVEQG